MAVGPISNGKYTALRVIAASIPVISTAGATAALFWGIPAVSDPIQQGLRDGGAVFQWIVLPPSILVGIILTALTVRIFWRATDPRNLDPATNHQD